MRCGCEQEGTNDNEEKKKVVQSPASKSYLWDVFLYLRLPKKNKCKDSEASERRKIGVMQESSEVVNK